MENLTDPGETGALPKYLATRGGRHVGRMVRIRGCHKAGHESSCLPCTPVTDLCKVTAIFTWVKFIIDVCVRVAQALGMHMEMRRLVSQPLYLNFGVLVCDMGTLKIYLMWVRTGKAMKVAHPPVCTEGSSNVTISAFSTKPVRKRGSNVTVSDCTKSPVGQNKDCSKDTSNK